MYIWHYTPKLYGFLPGSNFLPCQLASCKPHPSQWPSFCIVEEATSCVGYSIFLDLPLTPALSARSTTATSLMLLPASHGYQQPCLTMAAFLTSLKFTVSIVQAAKKNSHYGVKGHRRIKAIFLCQLVWTLSFPVQSTKFSLQTTELEVEGKTADMIGRPSSLPKSWAAGLQNLRCILTSRPEKPRRSGCSFPLV